MAHKSQARIGGAHAPVKTADATNNFMGLQGCEKLSGRCRTVRTAAIKVKRERGICVRQRWRAMAQTDRAYDVVQCYLAMDEFGVGKPNYSYPVHSLYLDSDNLEIYWRTVNGDKNRFKLRLRYYTDHPDTPVFFEIKRRMKDVILKQRGGVRQSAVPLLLSGQLPEEKHMITKDPGSLVA